MSREKIISDELINAFVDNQLSLEDKEQLYSQISSDQELNRQVCEIRKIRDMLQLAYRDVPQPPVTGKTESARRNWRNVAAGFVLALGIVIGWQINVANHSGKMLMSGAPAANNQIKVLFHLNSDDPQRVKEALVDVEGLMKFYCSNIF